MSFPIFIFTHRLNAKWIRKQNRKEVKHVTVFIFEFPFWETRKKRRKMNQLEILSKRSQTFLANLYSFIASSFRHYCFNRPFEFVQNNFLFWLKMNWVLTFSQTMCVLSQAIVAKLNFHQKIRFVMFSWHLLSPIWSFRFKFGYF